MIKRPAKKVADAKGKGTSADVADAMGRHAGKGTSADVADYGFWLDDDPLNQTWYSALQIADREGDLAPLTALLRGKHPPTSTICFFLADFLERRHLIRRRGGQQVPAYDMSRYATLMLAVEDVRKRVGEGTKTEDALSGVAEKYSLSESTLAAAHGGRLGNLRRAERRLRRPAS